MPTDSTANDGFDWRSTASEEEVGLRDRLSELYQRSVREPALVAWSDIRTRAGIVILTGYIVMALVDVFGLWRDASPNQSSQRLLAPFVSLKYPLGTTQSGVDLLALIIDSTPFILLMVFAGGVWATSLAVLVGTVSGYKGGRVDTVITSISDFFMAIPGLPLVIVLSSSPSTTGRASGAPYARRSSPYARRATSRPPARWGRGRCASSARTSSRTSCPT